MMTVMIFMQEVFFFILHARHIYIYSPHERQIDLANAHRCSTNH